LYLDTYKVFLSQAEAEEELEKIKKGFKGGK